MSERIQVFPDLEALSTAAAEQVTDLIRATVAVRGRFNLALSGGNTPRTLYSLLSEQYRDEIPWTKVHFFWGDERYLPHGDPRSNYRMAYETLLSPLNIPPENIHPMETHYPDPEESARAYEEMLVAHFRESLPRFDLILLGVGPDGHTASLFPGTPAPEVQDRLVVPVKAKIDPPLRLSLTMPVLTRAQRVLFLIAGADKRVVVEACLRNPREASQKYPAAQVAIEARCALLLDESAAPEL